ncbi:UNVERIFIED_CONTAM: hypothetical protein GTU68_025781 [Idotea baltica]|nr:hypothetical protein [Idotea baltica]
MAYVQHLINLKKLYLIG